jgi:hypothetical protein
MYLTAPQKIDFTTFKCKCSRFFIGCQAWVFEKKDYGKNKNFIFELKFSIFLIKFGLLDNLVIVSCELSFLQIRNIEKFFDIR